jgi:hypothetical protein
MELNINEDLLRAFIDRAREFHAKEAVSIPEVPLSPADDWAIQVLADHQDDPVYQELCSIVEDLDPDQRVSLVALMWCGRGDYDVREEWDEAVAQALAAANSRPAEYLLATPLLADYLEEALAELRSDE